MFYFQILTLLLLFVNVFGYTAPYYDLEKADQYFADFIKKYDKRYGSAEEFSTRFEIFKTKLMKLNEWNYYYKHEDGGYEITQFTDQDEYTSNYRVSKLANTTRVRVKREFIENAPEHLDYRDQNLVTEVKQQGACSSCFVFAAVGCIEGMHAKQTGELISLSEQQGLDCSTYDCTGGLEIDVIENLSKYGCMKEEDYPYHGVKGECRTDPNKVAVKLRGGYTIDTPDAESLKGALILNGAPLAIALFASGTLQHTVGFVVENPTDCLGKPPNHAVLLVGYSTEPKTGRPYWIIKNSWGTTGGDKGYYYLDMMDRVHVDAQLEPRQIKLCATCFDLYHGLARALEMAASLAPGVLAEPAAAGGQSELLLGRTCQMLMGVVSRVCVRSGGGAGFARLVSRGLPDTDRVHYYVALAPVAGCVIGMLNPLLPQEHLERVTKALVSEPLFDIEGMEFMLGKTKHFSFYDYPEDVTVDEMKSLEAAVERLRLAKNNLDASPGGSGTQSELLCTICYARPADTAFVPCGHHSCRACVMQQLLNSKQCFFCKAEIESLKEIEPANN